MGRGIAISDYERGLIKVLYSQGTDQSPVFNCIYKEPDQPPGKSTGRPKLLDDRDERYIARHTNHQIA